MNKYHISVLVNEVIGELNVEKDKKYIDATLGGGGHTIEILKRGGKVLGIDQDQEAIEYVFEKINNEYKEQRIGRDLVVIKGNFKDIETIAKEQNFENIEGILFDLGISSHQVDSAERGFSFQKEGPLDMRMDRDLKTKAKDLVNILTKGELYELFTKLGEERFAHTIANNIVGARRIGPIEKTTELLEIINRSIPNEKIKLITAARVFQALRIAINDELNNLRIALPRAMNVLGSGGKIIVISFHSLEDRIVKNQFSKWHEEGKGRVLTKKPVTPKSEEIVANNRSRSAKLRVFQKE